MCIRDSHKVLFEKHLQHKHPFSVVTSNRQKSVASLRQTGFAKYASLAPFSGPENSKTATYEKLGQKDQATVAANSTLSDDCCENHDEPGCSQRTCKISKESKSGSTIHVISPLPSMATYSKLQSTAKITVYPQSPAHLYDLRPVILFDDVELPP